MIRENYLNRINNSNKPFAIYKTAKGFDLYTDFSKKIILNNKNINKFLNIKFKKKNILIVDSLGVYQLNKLAHPIVILQYSPKINLERLIHRLKPSLIIADGSNYKSYANNWENISIKNKIPFHDTRKKGAFKLEY